MWAIWFCMDFGLKVTPVQVGLDFGRAGPSLDAVLTAMVYGPPSMLELLQLLLRGLAGLHPLATRIARGDGFALSSVEWV
ncbi:hypothetical protein FF1_000384 [Malus domestica]